MIKYLVLSGGGGGFLVMYGVLKYLNLHNFWNIDNIKSIYATSSGSYIAIILSLGYDWESIDDYFIKRPWEKSVIFKPDQFINLMNNKGILDENIFKIFLEPLLVAKELSADITLQELYDYTKIELHIYTTNLNGAVPTSVDLSYKTHPDLMVYKAVAMSSTIPILFVPICDGSNCYIDGALLNNFPVDECINNVKLQKKMEDEKLEDEKLEDEILGILISIVDANFDIKTESSIFNYLYAIVEGMRRLIKTDNKQQPIKNYIDCCIDNTFNKWVEAIYSSEVRLEMIESGEKFGKDFLDL